MLLLVPTRLEMRRLFPELPEPPRERRAVAWRPAPDGRAAIDVAWCGFGLAAAGAGAAALLARREDEACLVGLAGTLQPAILGVGAVLAATAVEAHGLGLPAPSPGSGPGSGLETELAADPSLASPAPPVLPDALRAALRPEDRVGALLSVAMPSDSRGEAAARAALHPQCLAEEMEALAVLHAASALGRRVTILRGVSNEAGVRDKSAWRVDEAAAAVRAVLERWLAAAAP